MENNVPQKNESNANIDDFDVYNSEHNVLEDDTPTQPILSRSRTATGVMDTKIQPSLENFNTYNVSRFTTEDHGTSHIDKGDDESMSSKIQ